MSRVSLLTFPDAAFNSLLICFFVRPFACVPCSWLKVTEYVTDRNMPIFQPGTKVGIAVNRINRKGTLAVFILRIKKFFFVFVTVKLS